LLVSWWGASAAVNDDRGRGEAPARLAGGSIERVDIAIGR